MDISAGSSSLYIQWDSVQSFVAAAAWNIGSFLCRPAMVVAPPLLDLGRLFAVASQTPRQRDILGFGHFSQTFPSASLLSISCRFFVALKRCDSLWKWPHFPDSRKNSYLGICCIWKYLRTLSGLFYGCTVYRMPNYNKDPFVLLHLLLARMADLPQ